MGSAFFKNLLCLNQGSFLLNGVYFFCGGYLRFLMDSSVLLYNPGAFSSMGKKYFIPFYFISTSTFIVYNSSLSF